MGKHKATKVVRKKRCFPLILLFHCAATSVSPLFKCLELAFIGGGGGGEGGGVYPYYRSSVFKNLLVRKRGVSIDRGTEC